MFKIAEKRATMEFNSALAETYLEGMRTSLRDGKGKSTIASYIISRINDLPEDTVLKIADFGSCEGDMLHEIQVNIPEGRKVELHGFDYNKHLIEKAQEKYPDITFHVVDIANGALGQYVDMFDIAFSVNTLHEVYSLSSPKHSFKRAEGVAAVTKGIKNVAATVKPGGTLIIYDGIENDLPASDKIVIRLADKSVEDLLLKFEETYMPFHPHVAKLGELKYEIDIESFTRFITKSRYLGSILWQIEKEESYQYFSKNEFTSLFEDIGFTTDTVVLLRPRLDKWRELVEIETEGVDYPFEHILIISTRDFPEKI